MTSDQPSGGDMFTVSSIAGGSHAPEAVRRLAERLGRRHDCPVKITSEAKGYHIYLPCPTCLESHGKRELQDPKYAINASKYLGIGQYAGEVRAASHALEHKDGDTNISVCMRTRQSKNPHFFRVRDLEQMGTVLSRHPDLMKVKFKLVGTGATDDARKHWENDPTSGVLCPPPPGKVIPLLELGDPFHPAIEYLTRRGFDLSKLQQQFRCGFCEVEYPHNTNGIYYRVMPGGWRDTPQHRIIFHSMIDGTPMTWQARVIEKLSPDGLTKMMLNPYAVPYQWDVVAVRANFSSGWIPVAPFNETSDDGTVKFQPSKYRTAKYSVRELMGWDAACERADNDPSPYKWIVLCEGPLDAARVGPGGVAVIGSSLSPENLERIASRFHIVYTAFDTDKVGKAATEKIGKAMLGEGLRNSVVVQVVPLRITGGKDLGDMTQTEFDRMFAIAQKNVARQY